MHRTFRDAPAAERCLAAILLADHSGAQCGRRRATGPLCAQHAAVGVIDLPDGYAGNTMPFFKQPIERASDGTVKLACAEAGKHYLIKWTRLA